MVIFELRTRTGKTVGAIIGFVLAGLSIFTMIFETDIFSEGEVDRNVVKG